jgi:hypothetical protein
MGSLVVMSQAWMMPRSVAEMRIAPPDDGPGR